MTIAGSRRRSTWPRPVNSLALKGSTMAIPAPSDPPAELDRLQGALDRVRALAEFRKQDDVFPSQVLQNHGRLRRQAVGRGHDDHSLVGKDGGGHPLRLERHERDADFEAPGHHVVAHQG